MDSTLNLIQNLIQQLWTTLQAGQFPHLGYWSYLLLALLVAVEGPIATLLGGAAAAAGFMRMDLVFVSAATGNLTADTVWYSVGYAGQIDWLVHHARWLGVHRRHLDRLQRNMHDHARKILLVAKLSAGLVIPSLIAAGLARVPWRRWFLPVVAAEMLWTGTLVLIGYYATAAIRQVEQGMHYLALASSAVLLVLLLVWLARRVWQGQRRQVPEALLDSDTDSCQEG